MPRRRPPLSEKARALLGRVASAQRATGAYPTVEAVIRPHSAADWDSIHTLCSRLLLAPVDGGRLRLTRAGWGMVNHGRP